MDNELIRTNEDDCKNDPARKSFDTILKRAEQIFNIGDGGGSLSVPFITEAILTICSFNQNITEIVLSTEEEILKLMADDRECLILINNYFSITFEMLNFCSELEKYLIDSRASHKHVRYVIGQLQRDYDIGKEKETDNGYDLRIWLKRMVAACDKYLLFSTIERNRYKGIVEQLKNLMSSEMVFGNNCADKGLRQKAMCLKEKYKNMVNDFVRKRDKLEKKLKDTRTWKNITDMIFIGSAVCIGICGILAATGFICAVPVIGPHFLLGTFIVLKSAIPGLVTVQRSVRSMFEKAENNFEKQKQVMKGMENQAKFAIMDLEHIQFLINGLINYMDSFVKTGNFAIESGDCYSVDSALEQIMDNLENFLKKIDELDEAARKCTSRIRENREQVLKKLTN